MCVGRYIGRYIYLQNWLIACYKIDSTMEKTYQTVNDGNHVQWIHNVDVKYVWYCWYQHIISKDIVMILFIITRVSSASFRLRLTDSSGLEVSSRKLGKMHHMIIQGWALSPKALKLSLKSQVMIMAIYQMKDSIEKIHNNWSSVCQMSC